MKKYTKPQVIEIEITPSERIANCVGIGSIPEGLPPGVEIDEGPINS